jgi:hypothetical protein
MQIKVLMIEQCLCFIIEKDYCHPNPCDHEGQCTPLDNEAGYQCKCVPGYMGQRCSGM